MKLSAIVFLMAVALTGVKAQRPRTIEAEPPSTAATPKMAPAPASVKAKYEGGVFGYTKTMDGTLTFDDPNNQLLFKDGKSAKEFHIPYAAVTSAFADTQKRQPAAATVASNVPSIYSLPAHFIKTKVLYLTIQFSDPDTRVNGITSFKLENKELLGSVLSSLASKTGMTLRGDIYVRQKDDTSKVGP